MNAAELRKKLDEGLNVDNSGKSTPMQRLTPFLRALMDKLEEDEKAIEFLGTIRPNHTAQEFADHSGLTPPALFGETVSSDDATRAATAQTNSESDGASKSST